MKREEVIGMDDPQPYALCKEKESTMNTAITSCWLQ